MRVNYGTRKETKITSEKVIANFSPHPNEKISLFLFKIFRYQYSYSILGKPYYWNTIGQLKVEWKQINVHSFALPLRKIIKLSNQISVFQYQILYAPFVYDSIFFWATRNSWMGQVGSLCWIYHSNYRKSAATAASALWANLICFNNDVLQNTHNTATQVFHENATNTIDQG